MIRIYDKFISRNVYEKRVTKGSIKKAIEETKKNIEVEKEVLSILEGLSMAIDRLELKGTRMMTAKVVEQIQEQMTDDVVLTYKNKTDDRLEYRVITFNLNDSDILNGYNYNNISLLKNEGTIAGFKLEIVTLIHETMGYIERLQDRVIELESLDIDNLNNRILAVEMQLRKLESEIKDIEKITDLL